MEKKLRVDKVFCFRFDVDTELCASKGMPRLIDIAEQEKVHFTFFVNMGKAISIPSMLTSYLEGLLGKGHPNKDQVFKLSVVDRLGIVNTLKTIITNPRVGLNHLEIIRLAHKKGHEIGLHGGKNHGAWAREIHKWSEKRIRQEISQGLGWLERADVFRPKSFSSPGWKSDRRLNEILAEYGFRNLCDEHGPDCRFTGDVGYNDLVSIGTNLAGEPGGVGYLEWHRVKGHTDEMLLDHLVKELENKDVAVMYDHPIFSGIREIKLVEKIIRKVKAMGYLVTTIENLSNKILDMRNG